MSPKIKELRALRNPLKTPFRVHFTGGWRPKTARWVEGPNGVPEWALVPARSLRAGVSA